ncbi:alkene reductase [Xenorhabdus sp. TS4]|nr:alkene reductase [Xenorhabdus sp. TS4]
MTDNSTRTDLFSPTKLGEIELSNRIVMAPLTRGRTNEGSRSQ